MARKDWRNKPETYGFPYANGSDAYLPASAVDLPTQLTFIADSMVIGQDLKPWFKERWNLGGTEALRQTQTLAKRAHSSTRD